MPAATFVKNINNKKVLYCAIAVFFLPYIIFSFWNFPAADDYMIIVAKNHFSFWEIQSSIYHNWTGRYFATSVSSIFSYTGFLYSHYYLHSILLFILTGFSWLFCLIQINKHLLQGLLTLSALIVASLLLLILEINIIPEPVTAFYWFSSAVTYQLPLVLLIFLSGIILRLLATPVNKTINLIIASVLIFMLNGCNEIITLFVMVNSGFLLAYCILKKAKVPSFIYGLFILATITSLFLLFAPGISNRSSIMRGGSLASSVGIALIKFLILHWFFLKEPLWWFFAFLLALFFSNNTRLLKAIFKNENRLSLTGVFVLYVLGGLLIYTPVLFVTNGSLPLRAENIICFLYSIALLVIVSISIANKTSDVSFPILIKYKYFLFSILIFSSASLKNMTDSLLSGYFYNQVMMERLSLFEKAKQRNQDEITFDNYYTAVSKKLLNYPILDKQTLREIILKPPPVICFGSTIYDFNFIKKYYGVKTINIR